eukprot:SRR837773.15221.p1 GENE.SRR837773.15221~~SRR837773.15221.p1  ORF type:complete len:162 (-),score=57.16 SRR837773.15221:70-492(-)
MVDHNRRCLLAYLNYRLDKIQELRWEVGLFVPKDKFERLHESEQQYLELYNMNLDSYMRSYVPTCKAPLDLTADADVPEEENFQIRVPEDGPEFVTPDCGPIRLRKNGMIFVKRSDIEQLIRAGKVEHVPIVRIADGGAH